MTGYLASSQVVTLINYVIHAGNSTDAETFVRELALRIPHHEDELMTIAQQLEQKGMMKGMEKGMEKGMQLGEQRGMKQGKSQVAQAMLQHGMDYDVVMRLTGLSVEELVQFGQ